jgi:hypothetical protein
MTEKSGFTAVWTISKSERPCAQKGCTGRMTAYLNFTRKYGTNAVHKQELCFKCPQCLHLFEFGVGEAEDEPVISDGMEYYGD